MGRRVGGKEGEEGGKEGRWECVGRIVGVEEGTCTWGGGTKRWGRNEWEGGGVCKVGMCGEEVGGEAGMRGGG